MLFDVRSVLDVIINEERHYSTSLTLECQINGGGVPNKRGVKIFLKIDKREVQIIPGGSKYLQKLHVFAIIRNFRYKKLTNGESK